MNKVDQRKLLLNKIWFASYVENDKGVKIFSFIIHRELLNKNNFTEDEYKYYAKFFRKEILRNFSPEELSCWIFRPNEEQKEVEEWLQSLESDVFSESSIISSI